MPIYAINKQSFEVNCKNEEVAKNIQKEIENYTAFQVNRIIDAVLTDMVTGDALLKIDKLEIDLGDINVNEFSAPGMLGKFKEIFAEKISGIQDFEKQQYSVADSNYSIPGKANIIENELELVGSFLLSGDLPWWGDKNGNFDFDASMQRLITTHPNAVNSFVRDQKGRPEIIGRLLDHLKPATRRMMEVLIPGILPTFLKREIFQFNNESFPGDFSIPETMLQKLALFISDSKPDSIEKLKKMLLPILSNIIGILKTGYVSSGNKLPSLDFFNRYVLKPGDDKTGKRTKEQLVRFIDGLSVYQIEFLLFLSSTIVGLNNDGVWKDVELPQPVTPRGEADEGADLKILPGLGAIPQAINKSVDSAGGSGMISVVPLLSKTIFNESGGNAELPGVDFEVKQSSKSNPVHFNEIQQQQPGQHQLDERDKATISRETGHTNKNFENSGSPDAGVAATGKTTPEVLSVDVNAQADDSGNNGGIAPFEPFVIDFENEVSNPVPFADPSKKHKHFRDLLKALAYLQLAQSKVAVIKQPHSFKSEGIKDKNNSAAPVESAELISKINSRREQRAEENNNESSLDHKSAPIFKSENLEDAKTPRIMSPGELVNTTQGIVTDDPEGHFLQKATNDNDPYLSPGEKLLPVANQVQATAVPARDRKVAFILNKLNSSDPVLLYYLKQFDETELDKLENLLKHHTKEQVKRRKVIRSLSEDPKLLKYEVLKIYANIYFPKIRDDENNVEEAGLKRNKKRAHLLSDFSKKIEISRDALFYLIDRLPLKEIIVLNDIFQKKSCDNEEEHRIIRKVLNKLPEEALLLIKFLTGLPEKEIIGLISVKENRMAPVHLPGDSVLRKREDEDIILSGPDNRQASLLPKTEMDASEFKNKIEEVFYRADPAGKIYVENAGLCLIALYLRGLFNRLGYLEKGSFKTMAIAVRAVYITQYLVKGKNKCPEYLLQFNKILCGFKVGNYISSGIRLTRKEMQESDMLLQSVIENWKALKNTSIEGFRESFIERKGILIETELCWTLQVERKGFDMLLNTIPWGYSIIKLPWMKKHIRVEW